MEIDASTINSPGVEERRDAAKRTTVLRVVLALAVLVGALSMGASGYVVAGIVVVFILLRSGWRNGEAEAAQRAFGELLRSRLEARVPGSTFEPDAGLSVQAFWGTEMMRATEYDTTVRGQVTGAHDGQAYILRGVRNPGGQVNSRMREDPFRGAWLLLPGLGCARPRVLVQKKASLILSADVMRTGDADFDGKHWSRCDDPAVAARVLDPAVRAFLLRYFRPVGNTCRARFDEGGCQFLIPYRTMLFALDVWSGASVEQQADEHMDLVERMIADAVSAARSIAGP
ncbi:MAG: hypothetical protein IT229_01085 [Flavobacteriales bacterium]|nr:hypothetical protein [Flavobacteriales bacterium]